MPTYEYACAECGERLEAVQKFSDDPLTECPACSGRLRKLFSPVGIVFKGSGFYRTDSRSSAAVNGSKQNGSSGDSPAKTEQSSGADAKTSGSDSGSSPAPAKPEKKTDSGKSSSAGAKVA